MVVMNASRRFWLLASFYEQRGFQSKPMQPEKPVERVELSVRNGVVVRVVHA